VAIVTTHQVSITASATDSVAGDSSTPAGVPRQPQDRRRKAPRTLRPKDQADRAWPGHVDALRDLATLLRDTSTETPTESSPNTGTPDPRPSTTAGGRSAGPAAVTRLTPHDVVEADPAAAASATLPTRSVA
jgi:hypothetical protein